MDSSFLLGITTLGYLFASFIYAILVIFRFAKLRFFAVGVTLATLSIQTAALALRWYESYQLGIGHAPLTNMYESVVFFAWCIVILYLWLEYRYKFYVFGALTMPLAFFAMAYGSLSGINTEITPLVPALQSNWLISHVITCFIGYAAFAIGGALGFAYLAKLYFQEKKNFFTDIFVSPLPDLKIIDDITHKSLIFGFIWLSGGIITGAVWANSAWGTYWSWDPKETWSLITWFVYAITLHARYTWGWNGKIIAWLSIVGFISVLFTYYGVNFLLSGLHSYGSV